MEAGDLIGIYKELESRLASIDFQAIWPGFGPVDIALYLDEVMCFQGQMAARPASFMGNTALDYQGRQIAIWNMAYTKIEGPDSLDLLTGNLVHEIFHAFQRNRGESRFPRDLDLLLYPQSQELVAWTRRDSALLAGPRDDPQQLLASLAFIRAEKTRLSHGATANEFRAETAEGLAEYAGIKGLGQLNPRLARDQVDKYRHFLEDDSYLFDIRRRAYFSGLLLALTAEEAGINLYHDLASPAPLWDLLALEAAQVPALGPEELEEASALMIKEEARRSALLEDFQARFPRERPIQAMIVGYDPMNMTRVGDFLISTHFLMTDEADPPAPLMGDSLVKMKANDPRQILAIYEGPS